MAPRLQFPNGGIPMQAPQAQMVLATPFNDVQLLGMMAATVASTTNDSPAKCAKQASDLLFECIIEAEAFGKRVADFRRNQQKIAEQAALES